LLNTIALQAAAAIENALLCAEMVENARERAEYAAELQAASTVQQLLLQSASQATPGFAVDSVYLPASEVGGDFFFVAPASDGSITAIVGDVSGKGLTAAMRVAMILGALRRETRRDPGDILAGLNNVLIAQGQLGFTTACCVRIALTGEYTLANAGHVSPYLSGRELSTPPALPLGLIPDQVYASVHGKLAPSERLVLLSDGVLEARSPDGELYGFERLPGLTLQPAQQIADTAQRFGQEDDITVLTLNLALGPVA
jgi:serine phosphatase RsbU (regulator of sigma subunit)